jgi:hypothetical protein
MERLASPGTYPTFCPHSGQNFAFASIFVPQRGYSFFGRSGLPHSGQNFAPSVRAPQAGQSAAASLVRSRLFVKSCCATFSWICWAVDWTCATAISVSTSGAHS